jgi:hypothetical protein
MDEGQAGTVSKDIAWLNAEWKAAAVRDVDEAKGQELARLEQVEAEAWSAWERSKAERQSSRARKRMGMSPGKAADGTPLPAPEASETELKKEYRDGNPRFLALVLDCIARRCALLGLDAPAKVRHGSDPDNPVRVTVEERREFFIQLGETLADFPEAKNRVAELLRARMAPPVGPGGTT